MDDLVPGNGAEKAIENVSVFELDHGRYALDLVSGSQVLVFVQVDFYEFDEAGELGGQLIDDGKQGSAMTAPCGPEKDEHGAGESEDLAVKRSFVDGHGIPGIFGGEMKRRAAFSADRSIPRPRFRDTILCPAPVAPDYKTILSH
jgi:hypothetical protein